ncbi:MAG: hypothetical protein IH986_11885 [Planctomycetes bacterium]|nr:hypothetical protein [Planctomycetota bacterium]
MSNRTPELAAVTVVGLCTLMYAKAAVGLSKAPVAVEMDRRINPVDSSKHEEVRHSLGIWPLALGRSAKALPKVQEPLEMRRRRNQVDDRYVALKPDRRGFLPRIAGSTAGGAGEKARFWAACCAWCCARRFVGT